MGLYDLPSGIRYCNANDHFIKTFDDAYQHCLDNGFQSLGEYRTAEDRVMLTHIYSYTKNKPPQRFFRGKPDIIHGYLAQASTEIRYLGIEHNESAELFPCPYHSGPYMNPQIMNGYWMSDETHVFYRDLDDLPGACITTWGNTWLWNLLNYDVHYGIYQAYYATPDYANMIWQSNYLADWEKNAYSCMYWKGNFTILIEF